MGALARRPTKSSLDFVKPRVKVAFVSLPRPTCNAQRRAALDTGSHCCFAVVWHHRQHWRCARALASSRSPQLEGNPDAAVSANAGAPATMGLAASSMPPRTAQSESTYDRTVDAGKMGEEQRTVNCCALISLPLVKTLPVFFCGSQPKETSANHSSAQLPATSNARRWLVCERDNVVLCRSSVGERSSDVPMKHVRQEIPRLSAIQLGRAGD